jgi:hypothetical protein
MAIEPRKTTDHQLPTNKLEGFAEEFSPKAHLLWK